MDQDVDMYVLLELPTDVSVDRLRYVYEQQVADAARGRDHRRLLRLSHAFDALPRSVRHAMYPTVSTRPSPTSWRDVPRSMPRTTPAPVPSRRTTRRTASRWPDPSPARGSCAGERLRPASRTAILGFFAFVLAFGFFEYAQAKHLFGGNSLRSPAHAAAPYLQSVDAHAIANDLNRRGSRDDIACHSTDPAAPSSLTCRASDGTAWAVTVYAPPSRYTATITQRSTFHQSAYVDAWSTVQGARECERLDGALPPSVHDQVGQLRMSCNGGVLTQYLRPGNRVDYERLSPSRYRVAVTARNGERVTYDSATGTFDPPR